MDKEPLYLPKSASFSDYYIASIENNEYPLLSEAMQNRADEVKLEPVDRPVLCPVCGEQFKKKTINHTFCSSKGKRNCKARFWNFVSNKRVYRTFLFGG